MKISELSARSGVPTSSIKLYLREGLLPAGTATAANQAEYGDGHLERLALIRALREVARLPLEQIARVTAELDRAQSEGWTSDADPIGLALRAAHARPARDRSDAEQAELDRLRGEVEGLLALQPWMVQREVSGFAREVAEFVCDVRHYLYPEFAVSELAEYLRIAWRLSEVEFALAPGGPRIPIASRGDDIAEPTRRAILSSLLFERIFDVFRRCANVMRATRISYGEAVPPAD